MFPAIEPDPDLLFVDHTPRMTTIAVAHPVDIALVATATVIEPHLAEATTMMTAVAMAALPQEPVLQLMIILLHVVVASMTHIVATIHLLIHMSMVDRHMIDPHHGTIHQETLAMLTIIVVAVTGNYPLKLKRRCNSANMFLDYTSRNDMMLSSDAKVDLNFGHPRSLLEIIV